MIDENYWWEPVHGAGSQHTLTDDGEEADSRLEGLRSPSAAAKRAYARPRPTTPREPMGFAIPSRLPE